MAMERPKFTSEISLIIDGVFSSEAIDTSGEVVDLKGMDITTMEEGKGFANWEHLGKDSRGYGQEIVGKILYVKKIFKAADCETDRQKKYFKEVRETPYLYGVVRLYDGSGHPGAVALAAQIRDQDAHGEEILVRYSIEGAKLSSKDHVITESIAKVVALTMRPANRTCHSGILYDPKAKVAKNEQLRDFQQLCRQEDAALNLVTIDVTLKALVKAIAAGTTDAAPSSLTQGPALQREHIIRKYKNQALAAIRDFPERPFEKSRFKEFAKHKMPEVSEEFLDHFADLAQDAHLGKAEILDKVRKAEGVFDKIHAGYARLAVLRKDVQEALNPSPPEFPKVYQVLANVGGTQRPVGRYMHFHGRVDHLEDPYKLLSQIAPEGPSILGDLLSAHGLGGAAITTAQSIPAAPQTTAEANGGQAAPEVQPEAPAATLAATRVLLPPPPRPAVFDYFRAGMTTPHTLEFGASGAALDSQALDEQELALILDNLKSGVAQLKYRAMGPDIVDHDLIKAEGDASDPEEALAGVAKTLGEDHPYVKILRQHIFEDAMTPGLGNKYAYEKFRAKNKPGVYISHDVNDLKSGLNDRLGHDAGDQAIKAVGHAMREAGKTSNATHKAFRAGGDEFVTHHATMEDAANYMRQLHHHLDQVPPIQGVHKVSLSSGLGHDFQSADKALYEAKKGKFGATGARAFAPGKVPHLAHSLVQGHEGPIPAMSTPPPAPSAAISALKQNVPSAPPSV